jgi:Short C-terminal domain
MGFWNPRAKCPNCGSKIHVRTDWSTMGTKRQPVGGLAASQTGTTCPFCGIPLIGRVIGGMGEVDVAATNRLVDQTEQQQASRAAAAAPPAPSRADELKKLADLRASGALTEAEFEAEKVRILGSDSGAGRSSTASW